MKSFAAIVALVAVGILGIFWYRHPSATRALGNGEVYVRDQPFGAATALPATAPPPAGGDEIATTATPQPPVPASSARPTTPQATTAPAAAPPQSDSIPRNPPNGLAFTGSGKFQLYRQGDITWRLDTQTGDACILFATDMQWQHPRVYQAGCGTRGVTAITTGY